MINEKKTLKEKVIYILYNKREKRVRTFVSAFLFACLLLVLYVGLVAPLEKVLISMGLTVEGRYNPDSIVDIFSLISHNLLLPMLMVLGSYIALRVIEKSGFSLIGMNFNRGWIKDLLLGVIVGIGIMAIGFSVFLAFGWINILGFSWSINSLSEYLYGGLYIIVSLISVAIVEEIALRGYIFFILKRSLGVKQAVLITSLIFGCLHLGNSSAYTWTLYVIPVTLSLAGILFALAFLSRESLWVAIGLHFSWNLFEYSVFNLNGGRRSLLFVTEIEGPSIFVGLPNSSFGPEVGLVGVLMMVIGICYFRYGIMKRKRNQLNLDENI